MLDPRTLTFLEVCRCGSFTTAAAHLHVTQPAVSQHIRALERHYQARLFERRGRATVITPAGRLLYRTLARLANDEQRLQAETRELASGKADLQPVRLGATRTIGDYVMPRVLPAYLAAHPEAHLVLTVGNTQGLLQALEAGSIDFALVEGSFDRSSFASEPFSREPIAAVCAPELAAKHAIGQMPSEGPGHSSGRRPPLADLTALPLILREEGSGTREILARHLATRELAFADFARTVELGSVAAIKACAEAALGVTFLYRIAVERELATGTLVDVTPADFSLAHDFTLIWQAGSLYAPRYRAILAEWRALLAR